MARQDSEKSRRIRNSVLLFATIAVAFYIAFIVIGVVRA